MYLIGVAGYARSGKDTVAKYLETMHDFNRYAFADPIREVAAAMFGMPVATFMGDNPNREETDPFWGFSPRQMMQLIGTEGGRNIFGKDMWIKRAEVHWRKLKEFRELEDYKIQTPTYRGLVIPDVRFDNEAEWIRKHRGVIIDVERKGITPVALHVSEGGVTDKLVDYKLYNNEGIEELEASIEGLMKSIYRRYDNAAQQ